MIEEIKEAIEAPLLAEGIKVDSIKWEKEDGVKTLFIVVDADVIDLDMCTKATEIINPIIDGLDLKEDEYTLDVSGKVEE